MGDESGSDDSDEPKQVEKDLGSLFAVDKFSKREKKGHLLLQLQKTYKGDERFQLNKDFVADDTDKLPQNLLGSLSSREYQDLIAAKKNKKTNENDGSVPPEEANIEQEPDTLDEAGEYHWETELADVAKEKSKALSILAQFVPQSEIFFNHMSASK